MNGNPDHTLETIVAHWLPAPRELRILPLPSPAGLSGAQLWKVEYAEQAACLRRWPGHVTGERLGEIHRLLLHLATRGSRLTPTPLYTPARQTAVRLENSLWELAHWLPGSAINAGTANRAYLRAAMGSLAEIHCLAAELSTGSIARRRNSPGLMQRRDLLAPLRNESERNLIAAQLQESLPSLLPSGTRAFFLLQQTIETIAQEVAQAATKPLSMQWRVGDVHREHVLFTGNQVSGIVDFGAACVDSPAADVARLLGSLAGDDAESWQEGLEAYQNVRPLESAERAALAAFDAGGTAVAVVRWIKWASVEQLGLPPEKVQARLEYLSGRLAAVLKRGRAGVI